MSVFCLRFVRPLLRQQIRIPKDAKYIIEFFYLYEFEFHGSETVEYEVREKPTLNTWMQGGLDYIMLQYLNIDGIRTIGSVLGQSIALDYYVRQVRCQPL